jgi:ABC-type Fe3+-hydroxamate transport system substrate-binding protein
MRRRGPLPRHVLLSTCSWAIALACTADPGQDSSNPADPTFVDAAGIGHVFDRPAQRIISLVPSATQTLRAIGAAGSLVGRTDFDTEAWAESLPSVGGGQGPNLEEIVALRPDLVVRFAGDQDPRTVERLDELGVRHVAVRPDHIADIYSMATMLGQATGHSAEADSLVEHIRGGLEDLAAAARGRSPVRVAYVLGGSPPWVAGPDTYIGELLNLVGGVNVFDDLDALYTSVSPEEFLVREIDVVLMSGGTEFDPGLAPTARVEVVEADLEIPGPEIVDAAVAISRILHGGAK